MNSRIATANRFADLAEMLDEEAQRERDNTEWTEFYDKHAEPEPTNPELIARLEKESDRCFAVAERIRDRDAARD